MRMTAAAVAVAAALWVIMACSSSNGESINRVIGMGLESWEEEMMEMNMMVEMSGREDLVEAAGYGEEKLSKVSVIGKVVCHHHAQQPPHPVSALTPPAPSTSSSPISPPPPRRQTPNIRKCEDTRPRTENACTLIIIPTDR